MTFIPLAKFENVKEVFFLHILLHCTRQLLFFSLQVILGSSNTEVLDVFLTSVSLEC